MYEVFKDALVRKTGFVKVFWDDSVMASTHEYTDLDPQSYQALILDKNVEVLKEKATKESITNNKIDQNIFSFWGELTKKSNKSNTEMFSS